MILMKYRLMVGLISCFLYQKTFAILDGRIAPIYLENRYSFSNYEWARGDVYFKSGFDLPTNGTALIGINQEVNANIVGRNSTLRLENHLKLATGVNITGSGFIDARGYSIRFLSNWQVGSGEKYVFISNVILKGGGRYGFVTLSAGTSGGFSFTQGATDILCEGFNIGPLAWSNFKTNTLAPSKIRFKNASIIMHYEGLSLNSSIVEVLGEVNVINSAQHTFAIPNTLSVGSNSSLYMNSRSQLRVGKIITEDATSRLVLDNARLLYALTGTYAKMFQNSSPGKIDAGKLIIKGASIINTVNPNNKLFMPTNALLQLDPGARLAISPNVRLSV